MSGFERGSRDKGGKPPWGFGGCLRSSNVFWNDLEGRRPAPNGNGNLVVDMCPHDGRIPWTDRNSWSGEHLVPDRLVRDGEVVLHHPFVFPAEEVVDAMPFLNREWPVQVAGLARETCEPSVEVGDEYVCEEAVCFLDGRDPLETKLFDEPVLEGLEQSFHSALCLGRIGEDDRDAQVLHHSGELSLHVRVLKDRLLVHLVCGELVDVYPLRKPILQGIFLPEAENGEYTLMFPEREGENPSGGVVNRRKKTEFTGAAPIFEPMVVRAVELYELTEAGPRFAPMAMGDRLRGPFWFLEPELDHDPADGLWVTVEPVDLRKFLRGERLCEVMISGDKQFLDALAFL